MIIPTELIILLLENDPNEKNRKKERKIMKTVTRNKTQICKSSYIRCNIYSLQ